MLPLDQFARISCTILTKFDTLYLVAYMNIFNKWNRVVKSREVTLTRAESDTAIATG